MFDKLLTEYRVFRACPRNMRVLLITNMLYALVLPIVEIFVGAYIMRSCGKPVYVALYQLAMYAGIVFTSVINGWLLKTFKVAHLYCIGILFSAVSMVGMMMLEQLGIAELLVIGFVMGAASGFFWTNRYLITLNSTNDDNRNYFFGLESLGFTVGQIVVPLLVGALIAHLQGEVLFGWTIDATAAYRIVTLVATVVALLACANILRGTYENPASKRFLYAKFDALWNKLLALATLKGMVQGFLVTAPAILVMKLVGEEGTLGLIQSISGGITAILVYVLGRVTKPKHRIIVFSIGLFIFFIGTVVNGVLYSAVGVIIFVLCKVIFQPLHDLAYFPIMMRVIDVVSKKEKRNEYAYILSHEIGLFVGRAFGLVLFLMLAFGLSEDFALKYALPIVGGLQLLSLPLAKHIIKTCHTYENK
ncbi:MAG: MFS transporter [Bacteroidaceae bacterium]